MTALRPLLIVQTGRTHDHIRERLGDFDDWIATGLRAGSAEVRVHDATASGTPPPEHNTLAGIVLTGSHAMASDREPWSEALVPWLQQAVALQTPLLGICYGHPLLGALPDTFDAQATHWQSVRQLTPGAVLLAGNAFEPHHAFRVGPSAWGVQFHQTKLLPIAWKRLMRWSKNIPRWAVRGLGSGCFRHPRCQLIREAAWNGPTLLPRICCRRTPTSAQCRNCWAIQTCPPP